MAPKLFSFTPSPCVRAVLMTSKALNLNLELEEVDLNNKDQFKPSFLKINPQHTVPTLQDDDDFVIWDSHVINGYLVDKYGGIDDSLYPSDMQERAKVLQKLFYDTELTTLFGRILHLILLGKKKSAPQEDIDEVLAKLEHLEKFLSLSPWVAGSNMTIADLNLVATVSSINILIPVDAKKFPKIDAWWKKIQKLPLYGANKAGLDKLTNMIAAALNPEEQ